jgi:hypothetical protein
MIPSLQEVLEYQNDHVIQRFKQNHEQDAYRAELVFLDMLRYLWLCEKHRWDLKNNPEDKTLQFIPVMHEEMRAMDNMWHEFILITKEYHAFCHECFGHFIHHEPNISETVLYSEEQYTESLNLYLNYIYDVLGEDVLKSWFHEHLGEVA